MQKAKRVANPHEAEARTKLGGSKPGLCGSDRLGWQALATCIASGGCAMVRARRMASSDHTGRIGTRPQSVAVEVPPEHLESLGCEGATAHTKQRERVAVIRTAALPHHEVLDVTGSTRQWRAFHTVFEFCAVRNGVRRGDQRWSYRGKDYEAHEQATLIMEPDQVHRTTYVRAPADFYVVRVGEAAISELTLEMIKGPLHFRSGQLDDDDARRALLRAAAEFVNGSLDLLSVESELLAFLARAVELEGEQALAAPRACDQAVSLARECIHAHSAEPLTLDQVAAASGRTKWHLARSFKRILGMTIHGYLTQVRLAHAQDCLRSGLPPKLAAAEAGFSDQAHLTRKLTASLGITPSRYRKGSDAPLESKRIALERPVSARCSPIEKGEHR